MVQFSNILVGMVLMAAIVSGLLIFVADGATKYGKTDFDNSSMVKVVATYNEINKTSTAVKDSLLTVTTSQASIVDKVGAFFEGGYNGAKLLLQSFGSIFTVGDAVIGDASPLLGSYGNLLKGFLATIVIIIIAIGIVMHFLIKSDRI